MVIAELAARRTGNAQVSAQASSSDPSPPGYGWLLTVHVVPPTSTQPPPPRNAKRITGGGLLVFPRRFNLDGVGTNFRVPIVHCTAGHGFRADIGAFGIRRRVPPSGPVTSAPWFAGLTIRCTRDGALRYRVGFNHHGDLGFAHPGDGIGSGAGGGGGCSTPDLAIDYAHSNTGESAMNACRTGKHDRVRLIYEPTVLLGARVLGRMPRPLSLTLGAVTVDDQPYWLQPHVFTQEDTRDTAVVSPRPTSSWYRVKLTIG